MRIRRTKSAFPWTLGRPASASAPSDENRSGRAPAATSQGTEYSGEESEPVGTPIRLSGVHRDAVFWYLMDTLDVQADVLGPIEEGQLHIAERETLHYAQMHRLLVDLGQRAGASVVLRQPPEELRRAFLSLLLQAEMICNVRDGHTGDPEDQLRAELVATASKHVLKALEMAEAGVPFG